MQKIDGFYLYQVGAALQQIHDLKYNWTDDELRGASYQEAFAVLKNAKDALEKLIKHETYRLKTCVQKGSELIKAIENLITKTNDSEKNQLLNFSDMWPVTTALRNFEAVLSSELSLLDLYIITKKRGFDISELMSNGQICFPEDLIVKVPECIEDIQSGMKCIAVSLPTAAGFHLLRANEAVLRRYWDVVTSKAPRPKSGNMGEYIKRLEEKEVGDQHVLSALKILKDLYRNELIHPGENLESVGEAIALMYQIHTVIVHMLKVIPQKKAKEKANYSGIASALLMAGAGKTERRPSLMDLVEESNDTSESIQEESA